MPRTRHRILAAVAAVAVAASLSGPLAPPAARASATAAALTSCYGPHDKTDRVEANATDIYRICFRRGAAAIRVVGDTDTDLDCFVYNANDVLVARDADATDYCVLDWQAVGGSYRLEIRNLGDVYNQYRLRTN